MAKSELDTMALVRERFKESGLTMHELGVRMGFAPSSARQAVFQFLKADDPRLSSVKKFADALSIPIRKLID